MLQKEKNELIVISAREVMIEEMKDVAIEKFKEKVKAPNGFVTKENVDKFSLRENNNE